MQDALSPLAQRMLATLRKVAGGNGIRPDKIMLSDEEHGVFSLHGTLMLAMDVARTHRQDAGRPNGVHVFGSRDEMEAEIKRACAELMRAPQAMGVVEKAVLNQPGGGYGSDNKTMPIKGLHYDFAVMSICPTCRGQGRGGCPVCQGQGKTPCPQCRGQRQEWCGQCRGTGFQDGDQSKPRCTYCHGDGRTPCLRCSGQGMTTCQPCNGTGHSHCKSCRGAGEIADITGLDFTWRSRFEAHTSEAPRAVGHLMSQRSLDRLAAKGHITPQTVSGPNDNPPWLNRDRDPPKGEPATLYWHMKGDIPWCEATVKIGKSAFKATAAGNKSRVNNCPYFLDKIALKAPRLKNEALSALLRVGHGRKADIELARLYPVGLSERMRHAVLKEAGTTIRHQLRLYIIGSWMAGIVMAGGMSWFMRPPQGGIAGFVVGLIAFQAIKLYGQARFAAEAKVPYKPNLNAGWEILVLGLLAGLLTARHYLPL